VRPCAREIEGGGGRVRHGLRGFGPPGTAGRDVGFGRIGEWRRPAVAVEREFGAAAREEN
jgi:hypothetical protein